MIGRFHVLDSNTINFNYNSSEILVYTEPYKIETILSNLLDNASKYAGAKAHISVEIINKPDNWQLIVSDSWNSVMRSINQYHAAHSLAKALKEAHPGNRHLMAP